MPKPTPPARRRKLKRLPGERFATMPNLRVTRGSPPPATPLLPLATPNTTANELMEDLERGARIIDEEISLPAANVIHRPEEQENEGFAIINGHVKSQ